MFLSGMRVDLVLNTQRSAFIRTLKFKYYIELEGGTVISCHSIQNYKTMSQENLDSPHNLEEEQQQQVRRLLCETFTNNDYEDEQIRQLIPKPQVPEKAEEKSSKTSSALASQASDIQPYEEDHSMYKSQLSDEVLLDEQSKQIPLRLPTQLQLIERQQLEDYLPVSYEAIQKQYKMHLVNEEQKVKLSHNFEKGVPYYVNNHLKKYRNVVAGVEVFYESNARTFIVWTLEGEIIIYLPNTQKRIQFKPFQAQITALRISPNMQMMAVASNNMEFSIYRLRQPIRIQDSLVYRLLPKPVLFHKMDHRSLESNIIHVEFTQIQNEVECLVLNEYDEISTIRIQKKLLKYKAHIEAIPLTFATVFMFKSFFLPFEDKRFLGIVISSNDAVTFAILKPKFQLIFVRQQTNRASIIKQGRTPFIDFCENRLMIVWDKFVDIIKIQIVNTFGQPEYKVNSECHYFFAENSLAVGFMSDTLIYQFSRSGLRVYSSNRFTKGAYIANKESLIKAAQIYHQQLALEKIPQVGALIGEILRNSQPPLTQLRYLSQKIGCTFTYTKNSQSNYLVYAYQDNALEGIHFLPYKSFVSRVIDSEGNWRLGLNILKRVFEGNVYELDCIRFDSETARSNRYLQEFKSICEDYVIRFVEKTKSIIRLDRGQNHWNTEDIQSQQSLFLCDFLIRTDNSEFLMDEVVLKMEPEINCLRNLKAFILLKRLRTFGYQNISYYFNNLEGSFLSKLIYSLDIDKNQVNQVKSNAIRKKLYAEFVYLCTEQKDFYTPFVILMAKYKQEKDTSLVLLLLYFLKKSISGQKLPIGTYPSDTHKQILKQIILKILTPEVYEEIFKVAPVPLFEEVLPCFFLPQTLPPLNSLQSDHEIREEFSRNRLENDIIKSLIIGNIPKESAESYCKGAYWSFIVKVFARSLIVRTNIVEGLYYLTIHQLIDNALVKEVISKRETLKQFQEYRNLDDFIERLSSLEYTQLEVLLLKITKRYIEAVKLLLSDSETRERIYQLLEEVVYLLDAEQLEELSLILKNNIKFLAEKDITKLEWLLTTYYAHQQEVFLEVMKPYPELQLSLMSQFLKRKDSQNHELRVAYLELLAKLGYKARVQKEILTNLYPLDESLQICKKYNILKGQAYIYQRTGDVTKALNTHFVIIHREVEFMDEKDWADEIMEKTLYDTMRFTMLSCVKICKNITQRNDYESEIFWMKIVEGFQGLKLKSTFHHFMICRIINQRVFPQLFQQIISNVELSSILRYIQQNVKKLEFGTTRLLFILLVKAYSYESQMLLRCQTMMQSNVDDIRETIIKHYKQGFATDAHCDICSTNEDLVIRYPCGHQIHPYCTTNIRNCQVCSLQDKTYVLRQIINKQELKFDLIRIAKPVQPGNGEKLSRRQKLLDFQHRNNNIDEYTKNQLAK